MNACDCWHRIKMQQLLFLVYYMQLCTGELRRNSFCDICCFSATTCMAAVVHHASHPLPDSGPFQFIGSVSGHLFK